MATQLQPPKPELVSPEFAEEKEQRSMPDSASQPEIEPVPTAAPEKRSLLSGLKRNRKIVMVVAAVVLLVAATAGWAYLASYESTDDAQVDGHLHPISARISGTILTVNPDVQDSHFVQAGTVLAEIDPADFQAERDRAQADYERLQAGSVAAEKDVAVISSGSNGRLDLANAAVNEAEDSVASERAALQAAEARLAGAEANFNRAEADRQRYEKLLGKHEISQSEYDRVATEATTTREAVTGGKAEVLAGQKRIAQAQSRLAERKADLLAAGSAPQQIASSRAKAAAAVSDAGRARAQLTTTQLNLGYTKIIAPVSGIIGRKNVEAGQRVQPGQQLLTIIPVDDLWITANFKETQLRKMKPGQSVTVHSDASGRDYKGHIDAIGGATGSKFSLLPAENATGNYVKVVQRVPVRIVLETGENSDHRLRPGMSVEPKVTLR
ncbi:MAG TPA: HlyD family secretion protein [Candidatus Angelobacter sp.]|nr:HlyD family secretion protein [Candidatus Angelobacter sp.]